MMPFLQEFGQLGRVARAGVLLALVAATACKRTETPVDPLTPPEDAGSAESGSQVVKLLSAGSGQKRALKYQIAEKKSDSIAMNLQVSLTVERVAVEPHRVELPAVRVVFESARVPRAQPRSRNADDAAFDVTTELREARFAGVEGVSVELLKSTGEELKSLGGGRSRGKMTPHGFRSQEPFMFATAGGANRTQIAEALELSIEYLTPPLPEQPVGVGARWEVANTSKVGDIEVVETVAYELVDLTEYAGVIRTNLTHTAGPQATRLPGMPEGTADAELVALQGQGGGEIEFDLRSLTPLGGKIIVQDTFDYRQKDAGDRGAFRLRSSVIMAVEKL